MEIVLIESRFPVSIILKTLSEQTTAMELINICI